MIDLNILRGVDIRHLDFSEVGAWPMPLKALCFALAALLALLGGYALVLSDQRAELAAGERREQALRRELAAKQPQAAALVALHAKREQALAALTTMLQRLPARTEVPGLIEDISRAAQANDLRVDRIQLAEERPGSLYVELPIAIVVHGGYHQIGALAAAIATLPRLVTLHDFDLAAGAAADGLVLSITAKTYRYLGDATEQLQ